MEKMKFKKLILEAGKQKQQSIIDDFKRSIKVRQQSAVEVDELGLLDQLESNKEISMEYIDKLAGQLDFVNEEMETLNRIGIKEPHDHVAFGSVVVTDKRTFFVSVSLEEFKADGRDLFGLSTQAPLFKQMENKKMGDSFSYKDIEYKILEIF